SVSTPEKVVLAGANPKLAYEVVVAGRTATAPSNLHVFVDAATGAVLDKRDDVKTFASGATRQAQPSTVNVAGAGNSYYVGNVSIDTTQSGSTFTMRDPDRSGISCGHEGGSVYSGPDNNWGNGSGTDLETGCVDTLFGVQTEWKMLADWLGRNGINGSGTGYPASVGLADVNAYWNGSSTHFGHSQDNQRQATSMDVVGHEYRGARRGRPAEPLVLPARRGLEPGWRQAGQPDLQQLERHRRRHPEGRQDLLQRPAEEDLVVEPQGRPQGDPRSRDRAL